MARGNLLWGKSRSRAMPRLRAAHAVLWAHFRRSILPCKSLLGSNVSQKPPTKNPRGASHSNCLSQAIQPNAHNRPQLLQKGTPEVRHRAHLSKSSSLVCTPQTIFAGSLALPGPATQRIALVGSGGNPHCPGPEHLLHLNLFLSSIGRREVT